MKKTAKIFTLIELLVVVAIIGILASLLLPALGKARTKSYKTVCTKQLKQMGITSYMYTDDNEDIYTLSQNIQEIVMTRVQ